MEIRTTLPEYGNPFYNNGENGGWSWCITGSPTCPGRNVLSNCVGWACGRYNEIIGEMRYPRFCCNAEDFTDIANDYGLPISNVPTLGGIMVWEGLGSLAGHVAIVERIDNANQIFTSESGWNCDYFWNATRTNDNGNWGMNGNYRFKGCIVNSETTSNFKYRSHIEGYGWQDWKVNGETSGTTGESRRLEAIQIDAPFDIEASAHIEGIGWIDYGKINKDTIIGTVGESRRLECLKLKGKFKYRIHIEGTGWTCWTEADGICTLGSVGQSLRIEAIEMVEI